MSHEFVDPFEQAAAAEDAKKTLVTYAQLGAAMKRAEREADTDPYMALALGRSKAKEARLKGRASNREYAANDGLFRASCEAARVQPTMRQASKYRRKHGAAYAQRVQS